MKITKFELSEKETKKLEKYIKNVYKKGDNTVLITVSFTLTGIGNAVEVHNSSDNIKHDITDYGSW